MFIISEAFSHFLKWELDKNLAEWIREEWELPIKFVGIEGSAVYITNNPNARAEELDRQTTSYRCFSVDRIGSNLFVVRFAYSSEIYERLMDQVDPSRSIKDLLLEANAPLEIVRRNGSTWRKLALEDEQEVSLFL